MPAYYNEIDSFAAQWLRNLIAAGHIAPGDVDERSIVDLPPDDLRGYEQCHFFAGIGVWSYALRLAGWPDDRPVWTGSCPCQPFSAAGKRKGKADGRHLWPAFFRLIGESRPDVVFGEQVAGNHGQAWLDDVGSDLEGIGYAFGAVSAPACAFGAPHIRQRLYWVADADQRRGGGYAAAIPSAQGEVERRLWRISNGAEPGGAISALADDDQGRCAQLGQPWIHGHRQPRDDTARRSAPDLIGDPQSGGRGISGTGAVGGFWAGAEWIACSDGVSRAIEPCTFPLAHGSAARVGRLRAYGNAIVAPQAAEFIKAFIGGIEQ